MSEWKPKRFWTKATAEAQGDGWTVQLDGRAVKTPTKELLIVPTRALAEALAEEWDAQAEEVDPEAMPLTRAANSALDKVIPQRAAVTDMLAAYGETDLLCYRATEPDELIARQTAGWDPLLDWAAERYDARLIPVQGVMFAEQPPEALARLRAPIEALSAFGLTAFHDLVTVTGSLILALAVTDRHVSGATAWTLSRIDEDYQIEKWGEDSEAQALAARREAAVMTAERLLNLLCQAN